MILAAILCVCQPVSAILVSAHASPLEYVNDNDFLAFTGTIRERDASTVTV